MRIELHLPGGSGKARLLSRPGVDPIIRPWLVALDIVLLAGDLFEGEPKGGQSRLTKAGKPRESFTKSCLEMIEFS
jgi:hypothetical protein